MERLLTAELAADLADLLAAVSEQSRLGRAYCDEADYWTNHVHDLDVDDAETIAWLLDEVAGSPWLTSDQCERARAWAASLRDLPGWTRGPRANDEMGLLALPRSSPPTPLHERPGTS